MIRLSYSLAFIVLCIARANALTGLELSNFCAQPTNTAAMISRDAYIRGLLDGIYLADKMAAHGNRYCPPGDDNIDAEQGKLIVQKYLRDHPEELHREAGVLAALAIYIAFPCR
jgi:hypothetical protein